MRIRRYWSPNLSQELLLSSDEEYAEAFRDLFVEAVRCRLRSAYPVATTLSGGLDSSSVTCVARDLLSGGEREPLRTLSMIYDQVQECDEREFISVVAGARRGCTPFLGPRMMCRLCPISVSPPMTITMIRSMPRIPFSLPP